MRVSGHVLGTLCLGAALTLVLFSEPARAQKSRPGSDEKLLQADPFRGADSATFMSLKDVKTEVRAEHQPVLEKAARWYVYRLTWPTVQEQSLKSPNAADTMSYVMKQALDSIPDVRRPNPRQPAQAERQRRFVQEYGKALVAAVERVLNNREPIARVNAARILARLGESGIEDFADPLAKVVEDKDQIDAVKLYALRGLKELFAAVEKFKEPEREARAVQAVINFIHRPAPDSVTAAEELQAFHYVRREAVAALAQCKAPAVELNKKVVSQPALELLRVVSRDGFPTRTTPILSERVEAAVGVGLMQTRRAEKIYNPDYAAYQVGLFLNDFVNRYEVDRRKQGAIPDEPWKLHAARLQLAVQELGKENAKVSGADKKLGAYVAAFVVRAESVLKQVEQGQSVTIGPFRNWLQTNQPPSKSLYKNDPKATVTPPAPEA